MDLSTNSDWRRTMEHDDSFKVGQDEPKHVITGWSVVIC